jgi:hypothetical protein
MRKLASIQKIVSLKPISGADKIELAQVLGWEVIVKKGEFEVGDLAIYIEIDSLLPESNPIFEFMRKKQFKVKTMKMRGAISQGIIFPWKLLINTGHQIIEGMDVTEILGIKNFTDEIEVKDPDTKTMRPWLSLLYSYRVTRPLAKLISKTIFKPKKYNWPEFVPKTDEERIQNKPWFTETLKDNDFYVTEKLDGQSATYFCTKESFFRKRFGVCSRNNNLPKKSCNWWNYAIKSNLEKKMKKLNFDLYIQGELCGPGIQGNKYKLSELTFFLFNAYNLTTKEFMPIGIVAEFLDIKTVPILGIYDSNKGKIASVQGLVEFSKGNSAINLQTPREGIILRLFDKETKQSAKVINPDFLLKHDL